MDMETLIETMEDCGFEAVELRTTHKHGVEPTLSADERSKVTRRFQNSKVRLLSYGTTVEFHDTSADVRKKQLEIGKTFVDLAHDTGAWGIKVRPNGMPKEVSYETTIKNISDGMKALGDYAAPKGVEIWMEVHGRTTNKSSVCADIMKATGRDNVGVCWNSNPINVVNGSIRANFELLKDHIKNVHITELSSGYPYREFFSLLKSINYDRYTLAEIQHNPQEARFLKMYRALWLELTRG
jgi:sugar phosphate isomerase/epimerase